MSNGKIWEAKEIVVVSTSILIVLLLFNLEIEIHIFKINRTNDIIC